MCFRRAGERPDECARAGFPKVSFVVYVTAPQRQEVSMANADKTVLVTGATGR